MLLTFALMEHRGEIIEQAIRKSGMPLATIARKMGKSRRWLYLLFQNPQVSLDIVEQLGKLIYYDFSNEIQLLKNYNTVSDEQQINYKDSEVTIWKEKYFILMEEHLELLRKLAVFEKMNHQ